MMASNYGGLIRKAAQLLDQFDADKQSVEEFTEEAGKALGLGEVELSKKKFILDFVSGCIEHKKLLDIVINVFYLQHGKCLFKTDRNQFAIVCYLAMFLLDEIGFQCLSNIVKSLDIKKMHKFLAFFFNITNLTTWIQGEWSRIYDVTYVERNWIAPLLRWRPEIEALMGELASRISRGDRVKKVTKKATEPQEFSLTKPKARPVPVPEPIPLQEKHRAVPSSTYRTPKEKHVMKEVKQRNRQKAEEVATTQQFKCANSQKSDHTMAVISQIKKDSESQLKFDSTYTSGTPATHKTNTLPIRLNTTAILREGALYNRQVEEELRRIERLVEGAHEPSAFLKWQKEMREQDLQEELAQVERRHLEGRISYEEATLARARIMERNQKTAQLKKEETAELMQRNAIKRLQEEKDMKDLVQQVAAGHKNSKAARVKLQDFKQQIGKEVSEQNRELLRQALEEAEAEMSRRLEVIRQINTTESLPFFKFVDDTETGGHHLLGEMSRAEAKERLVRLRDAEQREKEEKRGRILEDKQEKEQLLLEQLDTIAIHRTALGQAALLRQEQKQTRQELLHQAAAVDERVLALQKKLEEKRQERQRMTQSERSKVNSTRCQAAEQALKSWNSKQKTMEEHHWKDLEKSLESQVQKEASERKAVKT